MKDRVLIDAPCSEQRFKKETQIANGLKLHQTVMKISHHKEVLQTIQNKT
jgi:hypothetical protein